MDVDFKLVTYHEPIETEEQRFLLVKSRNQTAYYATRSYFVYNSMSKTIYDAICCRSYRMVIHEDILSLNGFNFEEDMEPEQFIRFEFDTLGYYDSTSLNLGTYHNSELGIPGLRYGWAYYYIPKYQKRVDNLKVYDLDIIESYINYLKREQAQIRATEINLNLRKEPRPKRRQFPHLQQYKKT